MLVALSLALHLAAAADPAAIAPHLDAGTDPAAVAPAPPPPL
jgi:hypothetical protein